MAKKISYVRLQTRVYIKDLGDLGDVFPPENKTLEDLSMSFDGHTLEISFKYRNKNEEILVPGANIIAMRSEHHLKVVSAVKVIR